jgi:hypothetical protein
MSRTSTTVSFIIGCFAIFSFTLMSNCYQPFDTCTDVCPDRYKSTKKLKSGNYVSSWRISPNCTYQTCLESVSIHVHSNSGYIISASVFGKNIGTEPGLENIECYEVPNNPKEGLVFTCWVLGTNYQDLHVEHTTPESPTVSGVYTLCD